MTELLPTPLLSVRGLAKRFPLRSAGLIRRNIGEVRAVDDVSFDIAPGETLGLVGESGSGKTTVARCILRAMRPSAGAVHIRIAGETVDLAQVPEGSLKPYRRHMQMIFQDPFSSLNPRMTVGEIVGEPLLIHGMGNGREREAKVVEMLRRVGLKPEHRSRYPHAFSGGQRQRIGIARALILRPSFVVADESVSALDVSVQAQVLNLLKDLQAEFGLTYLFVAHNLDVVRHFCDRVAVMYAGRMVEIGSTRQVLESPAHPYTRALLATMPYPDPDRPIDSIIAGETADPSRLPPGCAFHPRCPHRFGPCSQVVPGLLPVDSLQKAACHLHDPGLNREASRAGGASSAPQ